MVQTGVHGYHVYQNVWKPCTAPRAVQVPQPRAIHHIVPYFYRTSVLLASSCFRIVLRNANDLVQLCWWCTFYRHLFACPVCFSLCSSFADRCSDCHGRRPRNWKLLSQKLGITLPIIGGKFTYLSKGCRKIKGAEILVATRPANIIPLLISYYSIPVFTEIYTIIPLNLYSP